MASPNENKSDVSDENPTTSTNESTSQKSPSTPRRSGVPDEMLNAIGGMLSRVCRNFIPAACRTERLY